MAAVLAEGGQERAATRPRGTAGAPAGRAGLLPTHPFSPRVHHAAEPRAPPACRAGISRKPSCPSCKPGASSLHLPTWSPTGLPWAGHDKELTSTEEQDARGGLSCRRPVPRAQGLQRGRAGNQRGVRTLSAQALGLLGLEKKTAPPHSPPTAHQEDPSLVQANPGLQQARPQDLRSR